MYPIITISREFGSGGHSIGEAVAKELNIPLYDSVIVDKTAEEIGFTRETVSQDGEYISPSQAWYSSRIAYRANFPSPQDRIFDTQRDVILSLAAKGPCVIVGRCADYILDNTPYTTLNVFIHANKEYRKAHVPEKYGESDIPIEKRLKKKDKGRRAYYRYYTDREWGDSANYHINLDSGYLGEMVCVDIITSVARRMDAQK